MPNATHSPLYIGLMSGTSMDGLDAVLVDLSRHTPHMHKALMIPYRLAHKKHLLQLCQPGDNEIQRIAEAEHFLAHYKIQAIKQLLADTDFQPSDIRAIGDHGQTIRHLPEQHFTLQIGDPNRLSEAFNITVVTDFRRRDVAAGGQGAPLVPAFHQAIFSSDTHDRAIINIGGMANITLLPANKTLPTTGFDAGPGNVLMDFWYQRHHKSGHYDANGAWAAQGTVNQALLKHWLSDPYFAKTGPKSTGREYFNEQWLLNNAHASTPITAVDQQATLCQLTARSIQQGVQQSGLQPEKIYVCGGGAFNEQLMQALAEQLAPAKVLSTQALGVNPAWIEAQAFAWLAQQTLEGKPSNKPKVTGAKGLRILGGIYSGYCGIDE